MRKLLFLIVAFAATIGAFAQNYDADNKALANFLVRMYQAEPFEGVRAVSDYDNDYLLVVLSLDPQKYNGDVSTINRVASVKAMALANRFFNGSVITDDLVIRTTTDTDGTSNTEMIENISEHSTGYVKSLQLLTNTPTQEGRQVFFFCSKLDDNSKQK